MTPDENETRADQARLASSIAPPPVKKSPYGPPPADHRLAAPEAPRPLGDPVLEHGLAPAADQEKTTGFVASVIRAPIDWPSEPDLHRDATDTIGGSVARVGVTARPVPVSPSVPTVDRGRKAYRLLSLSLVLLAIAGFAVWWVNHPSDGGQPAPSQAAPANSSSATSTGGPTTVTLGDVTVSAAPGSIARGQSLTVTTAPSAQQVPGSPSVNSGVLELSTSQGQPSGPVDVSIHYNKADYPRQVDHPVLIHQQPDGAWLPEATTVNAEDTVVTATITHFSFVDWVDQFDYSIGLLTGNRTDAVVDGCGPSPDWVAADVLPMPLTDLNAAVWACPDAASNAAQLILHVVNNRGYAQLLTVAGSAVVTGKSHWGPTSLEQTIGEAAAAGANVIRTLAPGLTDTVFVAGGSTANIVLTRPGNGRTPVNVTISAASSRTAAALSLIWTGVQSLSKKIKIGSDLTNCVFTAAKFATSTSDDPLTAYDLMDKCVGTVAGAAAAYAPIDAVISVSGVAQKLNDLYIEDRYPPHLVLAFTPVPQTALSSQSNEPPKQDIQLEVPATVPFIQSGITIQNGQHFTITASGQTTYGYEGAGCVGTPTVTPDGIRTIPSGTCAPKIDSTCTAPTYPVGALIARVGTGPWILVGYGGTFQASNSGELKLSYNEVYWADDTGSYEATISVT